MSSSFRRGGAISAAIPPGCKAGTTGGHVTSVGHTEWNALLGAGGQPLGTTIWLEQDRWTDLATTLAKYWVAEGISQGQHIMFAATCPNLHEEELPTTVNVLKKQEEDDSILQGTSESDIVNFLNSLPRNQHWDKQNVSQTPTEETKTSTISVIMEEDDDYEEHVEGVPLDEEKELTIAWQYRTSVQEERTKLKASTQKHVSTAKQPYCHSFDLSKRLSDQVDLSLDAENPRVSVVQLHKVPSIQTRGWHMFRQLHDDIQAHLKAHPHTLVRLTLLNPPLKECAVYLPLLVSCIRQQQWPVIVLVVMPPSQDQVTHHRLQRSVADVSLICKGFAALRDPPPVEFRDLAGLLLVERHLPHRRPPANKYGLKRDRRKLHIQLLHIPPEDAAQSEQPKPASNTGMACQSSLEF